MPRHPPNALTSRLRTHTTNDKTACNSRHLHGDIGYSLSIVINFERNRPYRSASRPTHRKTTHPASISRTHSQCQRRGQIPLTATRVAELMSSSWRCLFGFKRQRRHPSARLSSHKLGRAFALADLVRSDAELAAAIHFSLREKWWSLSGSNR